MTEIEQMLAETRAAHATSAISAEDLAAANAFRKRHMDDVVALREQVLAVALHWFTRALEREPREIVPEQIALQELFMAICVFARALKARRGENIIPGRVAFGAYHCATVVAAAEDFEPADLDRADELFDTLMTAVERERDAYKEALGAAVHALRSYQHGNASPDLAAEIADHCDDVLRTNAITTPSAEDAA